MEQTTLAYLAGIIDGEGCVAVTKITSPKYTGGTYFREFVQVGNTRKDLLSFINLHFPASIQGPFNKKPHQRPVFYWTANHSKAREILNATMPYLILKKRQAEICLRIGELHQYTHRAQQLQTNGRFISSPSRTPEIEKELNALWVECKALNKRGQDVAQR